MARLAINSRGAAPLDLQAFENSRQLGSAAQDGNAIEPAPAEAAAIVDDTNRTKRGTRVVGECLDVVRRVRVRAPDQRFGHVLGPLGTQARMPVQPKIGQAGTAQQRHQDEGLNDRHRAGHAGGAIDHEHRKQEEQCRDGDRSRQNAQLMGGGEAPDLRMGPQTGESDASGEHRDPGRRTEPGEAPGKKVVWPETQQHGQQKRNARLPGIVRQGQRRLELMLQPQPHLASRHDAGDDREPACDHSFSRHDSCLIYS